MKKFKIVEITPWFVRLVDANGKELQVGYKKNAIQFLQLKQKKAGDEVELTVAESSAEFGGHYFLVENDDYQAAMLKAKRFFVESRQVDALLAGG